MKISPFWNFYWNFHWNFHPYLQVMTTYSSLWRNASEYRKGLSLWPNQWQLRENEEWQDMNIDVLSFKWLVSIINWIVIKGKILELTIDWRQTDWSRERFVFKFIEPFSALFVTFDKLWISSLFLWHKTVKCLKD